MNYRLVERRLRRKSVRIAKGMSERFDEERAAESLKTPPAA